MAFFRLLKSSLAEEKSGSPADLAGPSSAGDVLRQQREALGLDLAKIAAALKIKPTYLAALEAGRPDQLPGPTYATGFIRAYADHLGLDPDGVLRCFKRKSAAFSRKPYRSFPMPLAERSVPGGGMLLIAMILAICGYGTRYYLSTAEQSRPQRVAEVPPELLPPKSEPPSVSPHSTEALAAPPVTVLGERAAGSLDPAGPEIPVPLLGGATSWAAPDLRSSTSQGATENVALVTPTPPPQGPSSPAGASTRIVIHAAADSWVQIRDVGQSILVQRVLKAGESYAVPDQPGLAMRTGNAGGLEITVDGIPAPPIGRLGAVRRNVALDRQALMTGRAVRD
jgi:cytoskeleton protein RodZ